MHCKNGLNNKMIESLVENKVAQETGDLKYLQDSMYDFVSTLKEIILGEYSPEFFNKYVDEALKLHGSNLEEFLKIPMMGLELRQTLESIDDAIDTTNQEFKDNLALLLDSFRTSLDSMQNEARDAYDIAVEFGFIGTKQEWLEHLEGDSAYKIATLNGFQGTEEDWIDHLKADSAYDIAVKNGYVGSQSEWLKYIRADGFIQAIQQFATNDAETKVQIPDYGTIKSLQGYIKEMFENGGTIATDMYRNLGDPLFKTDYMHVFSYGQSLSRGHGATPVSSTSQPYNNKTFLSGVLLRANSVGADYTGLKPLVEEASGNQGETPLSSMLNNFVEKRVSDGESPQNWTFIGSAPGQGDSAITVLNKGTVVYNGMIAQVQAAYDIAQSEGKTYSVWALAWSHGEANYRNGTSEQTYYNLVKQLHSDFFNDVQSITKQEYSLPFVMYQADAHMYYGRKELTIATAQLRLSNETKDFILATPVYHLPKASDKIHLNTSGSMILGKYYAKALEYTLFTGEKWQPLQPKSVLLQGKILSVDFNKKGLVFDTTTISETPNKGFDVWDGANRLDIITSVSISDSNRINIILSTIPPIGATLSYGKGRGGTISTEGVPRGNLRDNDSITDTYGLDNWCVAFELKIQS